MSTFKELLQNSGGYKGLFDSLRSSGKDVAKIVNELISSSDPLFPIIGLKINSLSEGRSELTFSMKREVMRAGGIVHGGVIMYALDTAMGLAVMTRSTAIDQVTLELKVNFLEQLKKDPFIVEGRVVRIGKNTAVAEGEIRDGDNTICAKSLGTWYLFYK